MLCSIKFSEDKAFGCFLIRQAEPADYCIVCLCKSKTNSRDNREHTTIRDSLLWFMLVHSETFIRCLTEIPRSKDTRLSFLMSNRKLSITQVFIYEFSQHLPTDLLEYHINSIAGIVMRCYLNLSPSYLILLSFNPLDGTNSTLKQYEHRRQEKEETT